jgi:hypothetical protein
MEQELEKFTATALRQLLFLETRKFLDTLEHASSKDLEEHRIYLKFIFDLIEKKDNKQIASFKWGKNSTTSQ